MNTLDRNVLPEFSVNMVTDKLLELSMVSLADILETALNEEHWERVYVFLSNIDSILSVLYSSHNDIGGYMYFVRIRNQLIELAAISLEAGDLHICQLCMYLNVKLSRIINFPHPDYGEVASIGILHLCLGEKEVWEFWNDYLRCEIQDSLTGVEMIDAFIALCRSLWSLVENGRSSSREVFRVMEDDYIRVVLRLTKFDEEFTKATEVMEHYRSQVEK